MSGLGCACGGAGCDRCHVSYEERNYATLERECARLRDSVADLTTERDRLRAAIEAHREALWGHHRAWHDVDRALYAALEDKR